METRCIIPKQKRNDSYQGLEKLMNQHKQMVEVIPDLMRHTHTGKFPDSNLEKQVHQFREPFKECIRSTLNYS